MLTADRPFCLYFRNVDRDVCLHAYKFQKGSFVVNTQTNLFAPVSVETAPEKSRPLLEKIQRSFKFIPNLFGVFANSPVLLEGYLGLEGAFDKGSLTAVERSIVLLAASVENSCTYCTAAHSTVLKAFLHVPC